MFGLSCFAGAPFSAFLQFSPNTTLSGLQATALLNSVIATPIQTTSITGVFATASLNMGSGTVTFPNTWTLVPTDQYRSS
jgi:hypothetical protein